MASKEVKINYRHWLELPSLTIREAALLLHGLNPRLQRMNFNFRLERNTKFRRTFEIIESAAAAEEPILVGNQGRVSPIKLVKWIRENGKNIAFPTEISEWFGEKIRNGEVMVGKKPHGNTERHAGNREEVLGAALAIALHFPEECRFKNNKPNAARIRELVEKIPYENWPGGEGPPLMTNRIATTINSWLNNFPREKLTVNFKNDQ